MIFHLTDGGSQTDAEPVAQKIAALSTTDGNALHRQCVHRRRPELSGPPRFPRYVSEAEVGSNVDNIRLLPMSSVVPERFGRISWKNGIFPALRMKLLMARVAYDDILQSREHEVPVNEKLRRSNMNDDVHAEVAIRSIRNAERIALETPSLASRTTSIPSTRCPPPNSKRRSGIVKASIGYWLRNQMKVFGLPRSARISIRTRTSPDD